MLDYSGKTIFLGIDVHKRTYSVTAICDGSIVKRCTLEACPETLLKFCQKAFKGATIKSAYEAGFCGFTLHRYLIDRGIHNIVVNPASIEVESRNLKKTDKKDSKKIAEQLSVGRLHCVFIPTLKAENRRFVSRSREAFIKKKSRVANQLKSLLHLNGIIPFNKSPRISKKYLNNLLAMNLNPDLLFCLQNLAREWIYLSSEIKGINKHMYFLHPNEKEIYNAYIKITGIGATIGRILLHELGDTMQFSNEEKLFAFCGLTPSEYSSGEHERRGHITRQGNPIIRKALVQAAWVAVRKDQFFQEYFIQLSKRKGACRAIVAVARKLIGRARCAIKKKDNYKQ